MSTSQVESKDAVVLIDAILSNPELQAGPRALLLLRVCQLAQVVRPDIFSRYWEQLRTVSGNLTGENRESFEGLRSAVEPPPESNQSGFVRDIVQIAATGVKAARSNPEEGKRILREGQQQLEKRFWPFGKGPAWVSLLQAWADVDRTEALRLLGKVNRAVQLNIITRLNDQSPLTPEEWDLARKSAGGDGITFTIKEIVDRDKPVLRLSKELTNSVSKTLLVEFNPATASDDSSRQVDAAQEKALSRYLKLVMCMNESNPDFALTLMEALYMDTTVTKRYNESWSSRFTILRQLLNTWSELPFPHEKVLIYLANNTPSHLRDFSLAQWLAATSHSQQDAQTNFQLIDQMCRDRDASQAWYLVTLVRRGTPEVAMALAQSSSNFGNLVPRIRRAWLLVDSDSAISNVSLNDLQGDLIGQFLCLGSTSERVEFLRARTENGRRSLPTEMWTRPSLSNMVDILISNKPDSDKTYDDPKNYALLSLYSKTEPLEKQFLGYLRMNGFGQYSHEELDPHLLATLVAWDDQYPGEVPALLDKMWQVMRLEAAEIRIDLIRNAIFERCQTLFATVPASLDELFVAWVKREMVDKQVSEQVGNTIYTFSLKDTVPFLFSLLSAEKVAKLSARRCDEIIERALSRYKAGDDILTAAAQLYASDKGLGALHPPVVLKGGSVNAWQTGVMQASMKNILSSLLEDVSSPARTEQPVISPPPREGLEAIVSDASVASWSNQDDVIRLKEAIKNT